MPGFTVCGIVCRPTWLCSRACTPYTVQCSTVQRGKAFVVVSSCADGLLGFLRLLPCVCAATYPTPRN